MRSRACPVRRLLIAPTLESRRAAFRYIAQRPHANWPVYDTSPLYDRMSPAGLESDVRTVSERWFGHESRDSVEQLACSLPTGYVRFDVHDRYEGSTRYEMDSLFRMFVLEELHGWEHETALAGYLGNAPVVCDQLGVEAVPDHRRCGAVGTPGSPPNFARRWGQLPGLFSSEPRMQRSRFHATLSGTSVTGTATTRVRHRTSNASRAGRRRSRNGSAALSSRRSRWTVVRGVRFTRTPPGV